ncbi:MAG: ATP-binding cassette domain-containing protein [Bacteroidota bacterium]
MSEKIHIQLNAIGKQFYQRWIFRRISHDFSVAPHLALVGTNGSGKSTLLRIIAGQLAPTEGNVQVFRGSQRIPLDQLYRSISWAAPYIDAYEDLNLEELFSLYFQLKTCLLPSQEAVIRTLNLWEDRTKPLKFYSSGMLQRAKVGMALFTKSDVLLLDEPTANMDDANANRMLGLIDEYAAGRMLVLASNMTREFARFDHVIRLAGGKLPV